MNNEPIPAPETKKRRGCFFYGCLSVVVLTFIVGILIVLAVNYARHLIYAYTDTSPMALPKVEMAEANYNALKQRVNVFKDGLDKKQEMPPLILTADELNALIARDTNNPNVKDAVRVAIEDEKVKGLVSIPLENTGIPFTKGRYLNGAATFKVSLQNGILIVTADSITVRDKPLPETFMGQLRKENLAKDVARDAKKAATLRKLESIEVKDGRIVIKPHANP